MNTGGVNEFYTWSKHCFLCTKKIESKKKSRCFKVVYRKVVVIGKHPFRVGVARNVTYFLFYKLPFKPDLYFTLASAGC